MHFLGADFFAQLRSGWYFTFFISCYGMCSRSMCTRCTIHRTAWPMMMLRFDSYAFFLLRDRTCATSKNVFFWQRNYSFIFSFGYLPQKKTINAYTSHTSTSTTTSRMYALCICMGIKCQLYSHIPHDAKFFLKNLTSHNQMKNTLWWLDEYAKSAAQQYHPRNIRVFSHKRVCESWTSPTMMCRQMITK